MSFPSLLLPFQFLRALAYTACLLVPALAGATLPIQSWQLPNGARVLFVENRALPMLDVSVDFPAGASRDVTETTGLAAMTLGLMRLGAGGLGETEISSRLADVGAIMGTRFDADRAGYQARTLSSPQERSQTLDLLAKVLQAPAFPADVLDRERSRLTASLKEAALKPESIAERAFQTAVFRDHPYGRRGSGEIDTIARITPEDLRAFHARWFRADWAIVAIMGDVSREEADAIARRLTDGLPRAAGAVPPLAPVAPLAASVERFIDHPASQSHILMGQPGIRRSDPDYFPLFVGNYILGGGGFASRMVDEVRQKRGLAYSAYSYFSPLAEAGAFQVGLQTKKEQSTEALAVVRETVKRYVDEGPTEAELVAAKQNLVGGFPLRIDSNKKIHDYLAVIGFYGLPLDYLDHFVEHIEAVSVAQIRDAFQRRVHPDRMVTVVVGGAPRVQ
jgi:zinc protease